MNEDPLKRLEEKIAFLEHHVTEQDKVMLELADDVARLRRELQKLREGFAPSHAPEAPTDGDPAGERPPHY